MLLGPHPLHSVKQDILSSMIGLNSFVLNKLTIGWEQSSAAENLSIMDKACNFIPSSTEEQ